MKMIRMEPLNQIQFIRIGVETQKRKVEKFILYRT